MSQLNAARFFSVQQLKVGGLHSSSHSDSRTGVSERLLCESGRMTYRSILREQQALQSKYVIIIIIVYSSR